MKPKKKSKPFSKAKLYSLLGSAVILIAALSSQLPKEQKVIGIIDGDTVVLEGKTRVRLRYVDAPEKDRCGYKEATGELTKLALGKMVRIEGIIPDQYGRGMALVYDGTKLLNKELVATEWVRYHSDQSSETEEIKAVSENAKNEKLGIYGTCVSMENTENPKCNIKGNRDKNKAQDVNKKYYLPGCAQYNFTVIEKDIGEDYFCTEEDAVAAGFTKAETCDSSI